MELISKEDAMRQFKILCVEQCLHARQQECGQCLLAVASDSINNLPVKEKSGEITFEQFREYCEKRNFVVVTKEFFPGTRLNKLPTASKHDEFEKALVDMFAPIMECEINHPKYEDTVADIIKDVLRAYDELHPAERKDNGSN